MPCIYSYPFPAGKWGAHAAATLTLLLFVWHSLYSCAEWTRACTTLLSMPRCWKCRPWWLSSMMTSAGQETPWRMPRRSATGHSVLFSLPHLYHLPCAKANSAHLRKCSFAIFSLQMCKVTFVFIMKDINMSRLYYWTFIYDFRFRRKSTGLANWLGEPLTESKTLLHSQIFKKV